MKNVTYSLTMQEKQSLQETAKSVVETLKEQFLSSGKNEKAATVMETVWIESARLIAIFKQLQADGIAEINKKEDNYFSYGAMIKQEFFSAMDATEGFDAEEYETETRRQAARCVNEGVWCHTLIVFDEQIDAVGAVIGKDFHVKGHDLGFYAQALDVVKHKQPEYYEQLVDATSEI